MNLAVYRYYSTIPLTYTITILYLHYLKYQFSAKIIYRHNIIVDLNLKITTQDILLFIFINPTFCHMDVKYTCMNVNVNVIIYLYYIYYLFGLHY